MNRLLSQTDPGPQLSDDVHIDTGDYVIVVNAEKIRVTGNKMKNKMYHRYTGYIGNLKSMSLEKLMKETPERALQYAVKGMMPRN